MTGALPWIVTDRGLRGCNTAVVKCPYVNLNFCSPDFISVFRNNELCERSICEDVCAQVGLGHVVLTKTDSYQNPHEPHPMMPHLTHSR